MSLIYSNDHRISVRTSEIMCFDDDDDDVFMLWYDTGQRPAHAGYIYVFIIHGKSLYRDTSYVSRYSTFGRRTTRCRANNRTLGEKEKVCESSYC